MKKINFYTLKLDLIQIKDEKSKKLLKELLYILQEKEQIIQALKTTIKSEFGIYQRSNKTWTRNFIMSLIKIN